MLLRRQRPPRNREGCCPRRRRVHLRLGKTRRGALWSAGTGNPRAGAVWRMRAGSFTLSIKGVAPPRVVVAPRKPPPVAAVLPTEVRQLQLEVRQKALRDGHAAAVVVLAQAGQLQQQQLQRLQRRVRLQTKPTMMAGWAVEGEATMVEVQRLYLCLRLHPWRRDCSCIRWYDNQRPLHPLVAVVLVAMRVVALRVLDVAECPPSAASNTLSDLRD